MDEATLLSLAAKVVRRLRGKFPSGITKDDAFQDASIHVLEAWNEWTPRRKVPREAFVVVRASGKLKDQYAREWKMQYDHPSDPMSHDPPASESSDLTQDVQDAIDSLSEEDQTIIRMSLAGHTQAEIAEQFGVAQSTISDRLRSIRAQLADALEDYA